jgi:nucleoside-diphosphate-sugar epimerase
MDRETTLGEQSWDYLFIDDIASAILAVSTSKTAEGTFNLGSGQPIRVKSVVEKIRNLIAPQMELVFGEIPYRTDQVWHMEADIARLGTEVGWAPKTGIDVGLAATVQWFRDKA